MHARFRRAFAPSLILSLILLGGFSAKSAGPCPGAPALAPPTFILSDPLEGYRLDPAFLDLLWETRGSDQLRRPLKVRVDRRFGEKTYRVEVGDVARAWGRKSPLGIYSGELVVGERLLIGGYWLDEEHFALAHYSDVEVLRRAVASDFQVRAVVRPAAGLVGSRAAGVAPVVAMRAGLALSVRTRAVGEVQLDVTAGPDAVLSGRAAGAGGGANVGVGFGF